jgi:hypothetical protein
MTFLSLLFGRLLFLNARFQKPNSKTVYLGVLVASLPLKSPKGNLDSNWNLMPGIWDLLFGICYAICEEKLKLCGREQLLNILYLLKTE